MMADTTPLQVLGLKMMAFLEEVLQKLVLVRPMNWNSRHCPNVY